MKQRHFTVPTVPLQLAQLAADLRYSNDTPASMLERAVNLVQLAWNAIEAGALDPRDDAGTEAEAARHRWRIVGPGVVQPPS